MAKHRGYKTATATMRHRDPQRYVLPTKLIP